ncbi:GumC family protein [Tellurirhabdus bombi]|uniref:GumC family protein n=1 Tax=Tellurirhabdus bombi TaxID=2907205 RepID=UPI001F3E4D5B|nr:tyrosine-protein kinase family protein [Tellurirhabdus bombi]
MTNNNYSYVPYQIADQSGPNLRAILMRYVRHWKWFLLSIGLFLVGAYVYLMYQPPIYKTHATLLIKDESKGPDSEQALKELDLFAPKKVIENEIEILKSYTLMDRVVKHLDLDIQYFQETSVGKREIFDASPIRLVIEKANSTLYQAPLEIGFSSAKAVTINEQVYPINQSVETPYGRLRIFTPRPLTNTQEAIIIQVKPHASAVAAYMKNLKIEAVSKASTVLTLTLLDAVPHKAELVLNQLIEEYNKAALVDKNRVAANTLDFIEDRIGLISGELNSVEKDVESYKSNQGITDLSVQAETFLTTVQANDARLNEVNIQLGSLTDIERYVRGKAAERGTVPTTLGLNDATLLSLIGKINELELQRDLLARTTPDDNPILQSLDSQIKATKSSISENIQTMKEVLMTSKRQLVAKNSQLEGQIRTVPRKERALLNITRQQAIKNNLYTYLLEKREETALSYASAVSDSRTIDAARTGGTPVQPVRQTIYLMFGVLGFLLPIGVIMAKEALNNRVVRRSDIEDTTQVPILGEILNNSSKEVLVFTPQSRSVIAEQIRSLRTNLQFLRSNPTASQVLLFTSSISGEGKSFLSLNLGASLSLVGHATVILEMDLRKPKLHAQLGIETGIGLSNYLIGEASLKDIVQSVPGYPNYKIITSGPLPPNPSELLSGPRLEQLFKELREEFAYVIVDSPPIGLVTDSQLLASHADATLYVVRHNVTPKNSLKMIDALYKEQRFQKLNVILNGVEEGDSYYYSYGSGGYYEATPKKKSLRLGGKA